MIQSTLTLSSQNQVVIPTLIRKTLEIKPGSKLLITVPAKKNGMSVAIIIPQPDSWVNLVSGLGKNIWGKGEKYIQKERSRWEKP